MWLCARSGDPAVRPHDRLHNVGARRVGPRGLLPHQTHAAAQGEAHRARAAQEGRALAPAAARARKGRKG